MPPDPPTRAELRAFADANGLTGLTDDDLDARIARGPANYAMKRDIFLRGYFPELMEMDARGI